MKTGTETMETMETMASPWREAARKGSDALLEAMEKAEAAMLKSLDEGCEFLRTQSAAGRDQMLAACGTFPNGKLLRQGIEAAVPAWDGIAQASLEAYRAGARAMAEAINRPARQALRDALGRMAKS